MSDIDQEWQLFLDIEREAAHKARVDIMSYPPFDNLPPVVALRTIDDYQKMMLANGFAKEEIITMVENDLEQAAETLRHLAANLSTLGSARLMVLFHVAMLISPQQLAKNVELWTALKLRNYEEAADLLLLTEWPAIASMAHGMNPVRARRVLNLARVMRTGMVPLSEVTR